MNLQGFGAVVYGAMIMAILVFAPSDTPKPVVVLALFGAVFAYIASLAGFLYEMSRLRGRLYGLLNLAAWVMSILCTALGIYFFLFGAF